MTLQQTAEQLFAGNSEMARLMRSHDWSQTSLGAPEQWSQSLKTAVRIVLTSRQPMWVWWGKELINLYNDAYQPILGGKHPNALGQPASVVWQEIWDQVGPRAESAMFKNEGTYDEALLLIMERNGYPEETYYTFSYSPIPDDQGGTGGIICANTDDTQRIIGERQLALLRDLAAKTADARTFNQACALSASCLETNLYDLPFAMIYLVDPDQQCVTLAGTSGIDRHHAAVPETVALTADSAWSFATVIKTHQACMLSDLAATFGDLPIGAWPQPPHQAVAVPIAPSGQTGKAGILVIGLNPFRLFDDSYRGFIDLIAAQISASLANAQAYEEERKRAEALAALDRAKTTFFSNISHEFRTPLTLMLSPLEELSQTLEERLQPVEWEQLQLVQRNGLRLQKLVNTLLDFSRIEAGRVQAFYEPTDLPMYTAELASLFRSLIEQAGMKLVIDCLALPEPVYVDRDMWEKIVLNLLSNAFKFTFTGSITVRLQAVGSAVELSVSDTGVGIPETELPRLFERFHRVSGTRSRTYEGSGIGLALVQELVKLHGGTIRVASQLEHGTTFTITLPFGSAHLPGDATNASRTLTSTATGAMPYIEEALRWLPAESNGKAEGAGEAPLLLSSLAPSASLASSAPLAPSAPLARILLADDNADMRDYLKRLLSQQYAIETVADGVAALATIHRQIPDLLLTDVMMPGLDGFGLLQALRSDPTTQDLPIILLSARAGEEARIEGLESGADDYLTKPFSARELLVRVDATLKLAQLRREAMQQEQSLRLEAEMAKQQVETILSSINDGFYVLDRDWRFTYANDRLCEIIAMTREQILGYSIWDLFPDTVNTDFYSQLHRAFNEQTPIQAEYFYATWQRWYEHRIYPSPDGLTVISKDITDTRRTEAALHESIQKLRAIYDGTYAHIGLLSPDGTVLEANRASLEFSGMQRSDVIGQLFWEAAWFQHTPNAPERVRQAIVKVATGEFVRYEATIINPSGQTMTFDFSFYPICNEKGEVILIVPEGRDITDRKQAEIALQESEARFRHMTDTAPALVWMAGTDALCYYFNQIWLDFTGRTTEQEFGHGWATGLHPDDRESCLSTYITAFNARQPFLMEYRLRRFDGTYRWLLNHGVPRFSAAGDFLGYIGSCVDIHDRKQAEAEREQLLAQAQAAREHAETANRIKDEFLAVLSHELRSPLNPILGWSKLLRNGKLDADRTTYALETIERNAQLQVQLIDDLLDISRILSGKLTLNVTSVDLSLIIADALETVRLAAEAKALQVQTIISSTVGTVNGDAGRLQQVIWNLLSNAVKFTPAGGHVEVRLEHVKCGQDGCERHIAEEQGWAVGTNTIRPSVDEYAQITVKDTGKGINPAFLPYVFEYFRQEDGATTRKFGGLGLGLAIVRQIVELHGGTVAVDSPGEGQGSTFTVQIPLASRAMSLSAAKPVSALALDLSGMKILVVDDDADSRALIAFVLKQAHASVTSVASGLEALQWMYQATPDLVVSDIGMPEMDGYMLIQQIRALKQGKNVPAIALTAYAGEINQKQALAAGFQTHLSKPVEPSKLVLSIVQLMNHTSRQR